MKRFSGKDLRIGDVLKFKSEGGRISGTLPLNVNLEIVKMDPSIGMNSCGDINVILENGAKVRVHSRDYAIYEDLYELVSRINDNYEIY